MKIYEHVNQSIGWKCPVCNTDEDKPVTLIPMQWTECDGLAEAVPVHVDCIKLTMIRGAGIRWITQPIPGDGGQ